MKNRYSLTVVKTHISLPCACRSCACTPMHEVLMHIFVFSKRMHLLKMA